MAYIPASVMIREVLRAGRTKDWLAHVIGVSPSYITKRPSISHTNTRNQSLQD